MELITVIKELGRIKHNCSYIEDNECINGMCPYSRRDKNMKIHCLFEDLGLNMPCDWEIPDEI